MIKIKRKKELLLQVKMLNLVFNKLFKYQIIGIDLKALKRLNKIMKSLQEMKKVIWMILK